MGRDEVRKSAHRESGPACKLAYTVMLAKTIGWAGLVPGNGVFRPDAIILQEFLRGKIDFVPGALPVKVGA